MSLIVLNSQGQDPAEFENHFGRGLKLPKNAEICLCGVNLNKWEKAVGANIIQDINDAFIVAYGNERDYLPCAPYLVKIKSGNFTASGLGSELANALAVGNYFTSFVDGNFQDIPVSPFRNGGLLAAYDAANSKMKFTCNRSYINAETRFDPTGWLGTCGSSPNSGNLVVAPLDTEINIGTTKGTNQIITAFAEDATYAAWTPTTGVKGMLKAEPLWICSNGAGILQPSPGVIGTAVPNTITPPVEFGYSWAMCLGEDTPVNYVLGLRGGIFRDQANGIVNTTGGINSYSEDANRKNLALNWSVGGAKYDLWWEVEEFVQAGATPQSGSYTFGVYYMPIAKINNGQPYLRSNAVKVGEGRWATGTGAAGSPTSNFCVINFRPVDGKGGTDANAPVATTAADRTKMCIDFRYSRGTPLSGITGGAGGVAGSMNNASGGGTAGYKAITDGGDFDLYKGAPIFMGGNFDEVAAKEFNLSTLPPENALLMKGIEHGTASGNITSMSAINGDATYVSGGGVIANMEFAFLPVNFAFSPLLESNNAPFLKQELITTANRYSNIAATIGFEEGGVSTLTSANSATGLSSSFEDSGWNDKETLCIVQLPNIPIDGELGGGSGNYGGANTAQILGVVGLATNNETTGHVYREPFMENWIKVKNLGHDAINQLKVKLTDTTGRKLKCLVPESTIWIKMRECKNDGGVRTGGVNPVNKPQSMLDRGYNSFY